MEATKEVKKEVKNITITDINSEGLGVGRSNDFSKVLFIKNAVMGEVLDAEITKEEKNFALAEITKITQKSPFKKEALCKHFGLCGGCSVQHITYQGQLEAKQKQVKDALFKIAKIENTPISPIIPAVQEFEYRNKMDFAFSNFVWITNEAESKERRALGLHTTGRFDRVLNIYECHLMPAKVSNIVNFIREFCIKRNTSFWDAKAKKGVMRSLIVRTNAKGELCVIIIFGEQPKVLQADLCMALKQNFTDISSLYWGVNKKEMDVISDTKLYGFIGEPSFTQNLLGMNFKVPIAGFAQINTKMAEKLIEKVLEVGNFKPDDLVLDLYSGIGTFSLHIAKKVKKVLGIEVVGSSVQSARDTAKEEGIANTRFFKGKVEETLNEGFIIENGKPNTIVLDPPRNGLEKTALSKILEIGVEKLVYVSCNPASFARDTALLKEKYTLLECHPLDMFPQTTHVELVAIFKKL
jgi:23S rRNA (uracil1939-C5)-methyltransferase